MKTKNKLVGNIGEEMATNYLLKKKYKILERNFRIPSGEIDIIAKDGKTVVFIEVKRRLSLDFGMPAEAVNMRKANKIRVAANCFLDEQIKLGKLKEDTAIRFDIIEIVDDQITQIEDAF